MKIFRGSFYAWLFILVVAALMPIQAKTGFVDFTLIVTGLGLVLSGYTGIDQLAAIDRTKLMANGSKFRGNRVKLEAIVIATMLLIIESLVLEYTMVPGKGILPIEEIILMSAIVTATFIAGEKGKTKYERSQPDELEVNRI